MQTAKVDSKRRIRIPDAEPEEVYALERDKAGRFILTRVQVNPSEETFPPGSLQKFITSSRNREQLALLSGCTLDTPER